MTKPPARYRVFGGELVHPQKDEFRDPKAVHEVGTFESYEAAVSAWHAEAWRTVDNALIRYFVQVVA